MKVINISGINDLCKSSKLLAFWERKNNKSAFMCLALGCHNFATMGAVVRKENDEDKKLYTIPFCVAHNVSSEPFEIVSEDNLLSFDLLKLCGESSNVVYTQ